MIPPRKVCSNSIFGIFLMEVCHVNIGDLKDENGGLVPLLWFNKEAKAADTLYAVTVFTLLAGNHRMIRSLNVGSLKSLSEKPAKSQ